MLAHLLFGNGEQGTTFPYSRSLLGAVSGLASTESPPCSGDPAGHPGLEVDRGRAWCSPSWILQADEDDRYEANVRR